MAGEKSWPFLEADRIFNALEGKVPDKGYVLFETGYGPSGLPHIGTFGEVVRTNMVRRAFEDKYNIKTKIFVISDDMDGMRKIPSNLPNQDMLTEHLDKPLTAVQDPFGEYASLGANMNSKLCNFLNRFDFDYEFKSSSKCYKDGVYDEKLLLLLSNYEKVMAIMLPSLREERQKSYSPFLPICPRSGKVLQVPLTNTNYKEGTITYIDEMTTEEVTVKVTGGGCKLQWKPDWGMRWSVFDVNYEMYGKDLQPSADLSSKICRVLKSRVPTMMRYELFLDADSTKISKSKGNGLSVNDWLKYASIESLSLYMYQKPSTAKRLCFDVIPKAMDEYISFANSYHKHDDNKGSLKDNPAWHIHGNNVPSPNLGSNLSFSLLLNLAAACNPDNKDVLWGFIKKYDSDLNPETHKFIDNMVSFAVQYYFNFIKPIKKYRRPTEKEVLALKSLLESLKGLSQDDSAEDLQRCIFSIGKDHDYTNLKDWFKCLYEVLLGQSQGPRMGSFIKLYGISETKKLIESCIE